MRSLWLIVWYFVCAPVGLLAHGVGSHQLSGGSVGLFSAFQRHSIGVNWQYNHDQLPQMMYYEPQLSLLPQYIIPEAYYHTIELTGSFCPLKKLQISAALPFTRNALKTSVANARSYGIGEVRLTVDYLIFNTDTTQNLWKHRVTLGSGIKFPSGRAVVKTSGSETLFSLQNSTGSYDFLFRANYITRFKKMGCQAVLNYRLNTRGRDEYRYGNFFSGNCSLFYEQALKKISLLPNIGVSYEMTQQTRYKELYLRGSENHVWWGNIGLELYAANIQIGCSLALPISKMKEDAPVFQKERLNVSFNYYI